MHTYTKSQLTQMTFRSQGFARAIDANGNGYVSKTEASKPLIGRTPDQLRRFATLHKEALTALKRSSAVSPGQLYGYAKGLTDEMRKVMDTRGNKDHKLQPNELRYLSAGAKALVRLYDALQYPVGKFIEPAPSARPAPARPSKPKPKPKPVP